MEHELKIAQNLDLNEEILTDKMMNIKTVEQDIGILIYAAD